MKQLEEKNERLSREIQVSLMMQFKQMAAGRMPLPSFADVEFSCYSQNGEDGMLLYIFSLIGAKNKKTLEVCAGDGIECNSANLIINHGWDGLLFDGNEDAIRKGVAYYRGITNAWRLRRLPPKLVHAWITCDNIDKLISDNGFEGEIDLMTIDMDGNDFWVWQSIKCVNPRVVIVEYNNRWDSNDSVSVPYIEDFTAQDFSPSGSGYFGASLSAFNKLANIKGYRLIGANSPNTNAVFMRNDVGLEYFKEIPVDDCLSSDYAKNQNQTKLPLIKDKPIVLI
jgi:hypothetical protein